MAFSLVIVAVLGALASVQAGGYDYQPKYETYYTLSYPETNCATLFHLAPYQYEQSYGYGNNYKKEDYYVKEYPEVYCATSWTATEKKQYYPTYNQATYYKK